MERGRREREMEKRGRGRENEMKMEEGCFVQNYCSLVHCIEAICSC